MEDDGSGRVAAVREMRSASAKQQEGELAAARKLLGSSERRQQVLIEQLASEQQKAARAMAEANALRQIANDYSKMREEHAAALEMLGEKEEELDALRARST